MALPSPPPANATAEVGNLLQHARTKLPGYAVPRELIIVSEFPRTSSGKIDRKEIINQFLNTGKS